MVDLNIYQSKNGTIIYPYRRKQCKDLEYHTSIYDKVYHKSKEMTGFYVDQFREDNGAFVTHYLPESYLKSYFPEYSLIKTRETSAPDINKENQFRLWDTITLSEVQGQISTEVIGGMKSTKEWFINLQTGAGKTVLGTYLSSYFNKKTLIVCFMKDILAQWRETYFNMTNINHDRVMEINSLKFLDNIYFNQEGDPNHDIYLISPSLITMYLNKNPWERFTDVIDQLGIGTIIYDEGHRNMSAMVKINALTNIKYTLYLSADYAQGDYIKEKLYYNIFKKTKIIKPEEEIAKSLKHTKVIVVDYNSKPSVNESTMIYNRYGFSAEYYMDYQLKKGKIFEVLDYIMNLIKINRRPEWKTLILLEHIDHVDQIYNHLVDNNTDTSILIGRYHSKVSPEDRANTLENANIIVSTYKSFGTGMDADKIKYVISLNQCNKITANQAAGRSRALPDGTDSIYFMIMDNGFKYCKQKTKTVLAYLSEQKLKEPPFVYHL